MLLQKMDGWIFYDVHEEDVMQQHDDYSVYYTDYNDDYNDILSLSQLITENMQHRNNRPFSRLLY